MEMAWPKPHNVGELNSTMDRQHPLLYLFVHLIAHFVFPPTSRGGIVGSSLVSHLFFLFGSFTHLAVFLSLI